MRLFFFVALGYCGDIAIITALKKQGRATLCNCFLEKQHPANVGVLDDQRLRQRRVFLRRMSALRPFVGVFQGSVISRRCRARCYKAGTDARFVHHLEHVGKSVVCFADQITVAVFFFSQHQVGRHVAFLPHFAINTGGGHVVLDQFSSFIAQFWHHKKRNPFDALWCAFDACQQQVDHIVHGRVVAAGDVYFLPFDFIGAIFGWLGGGGQVS